MMKAELRTARKESNLGEFSHWSLPLPTCRHVHMGQSCAKTKSIIMLLPKLTCPFRATWPLARLPICLRLRWRTHQVPFPYPRKPPAWPQANNIIRGAAAKCGVEERSDDRGPTFCLRRSPPQEPPEENASPAQRGPRREKTATALFRAQRPLH